MSVRYLKKVAIILPAFVFVVIIASAQTPFGSEIFNSQIVKPGQALRPFYGTAESGVFIFDTYQWQYSDDNSVWTSITGATQKDYLPTVSQSHKYYRRKISRLTFPFLAPAVTLYSNVVELKDNSLLADNKPSSSPVLANQPVETAINYTSVTDANLNYVKTTVFFKGITDPAAISNLTKNDYLTSVMYADGAGSELQSIQQKSTPAGNDVVSQRQYDYLGREPVKFLPFTDGQAGAGFRSNGGSSQQSFYSGLFTSENYFYSKSYNTGLSNYAAAALPGKQFVGNNLANASLTRANNANETVWMWKINTDGKPVLGGGDLRKYEPRDLVVSESIDVYGRKSLTYTDKSGKKILVKIQSNDDNSLLVSDDNLTVPSRPVNTPPGSYYAGTSITFVPGFESGVNDNFVAEIKPSIWGDHSGWICTYYVYDELGNLRVTIPPLAVRWVQDNYAAIDASSDWTLDNTIFNNLCFSNTTDNLGRTISKKSPELSEDFVVFDKQNRPVLTQDAKQRISYQWSFIGYDIYGRAYITGTYQASSADTRQSLQTQAEASNDFPALGNNVTVYAYTYYDNYDFAEAPAKPFNQTYVDQLPVGYNGITPVKSALTNGLITGSKIKVLYPAGTTGPEWLVTVSYYDNEGKVIQSHSDNIAGGVDIVSNLYDFAGKILSSHLRHQFPASVNGNTAGNGITEILKRFEYDHRGRVLKVYQKLNGGVEKQLAANEYNELSQLQKTTLGNNLESLEYTYNLQGKLTGVNSNYAKSQNNTHYFGYSLAYDDGFVNQQLDGNISGIQWRTKGDGGQNHAFGFNYDNTSRLTTANFTNDEGSGNWGKNSSDFTVDNLKYDEHSNIQSMKVQSTVMQQKKTIDNLSYSYSSNSNRLLSVSDNAGDNKQKDFVDANTIGNDYSYDVNGNLAEDKNKAVTINFNSYTDKPNKITQTATGDFISYVYDAAGGRLKKIIRQGTNIITYTYIDGFTYRNTSPSGGGKVGADTLLYFSHDERRVRRNYKNELVYDYFIEDHLGNVRMVLTEEVDVAPYVSTFEQPYDAPELEPAMFGPQRNATKEEINSTFPYYDPSPNATNKWHSRLNANEANHKTGSSLILKVMAGDALDISVKAFYKSTDPVPSGGAAINDMVQSLIGALLGSQTSVVPNGKGNLISGNNAILNQTDIRSFVNGVQNNPNNQYNNTPKAYLNYVLFNENFDAVASGYKRVNTADVQTVYSFPGVSVPVNGYAYVWISNESGMNVYFDDLSVQHMPGRIVQENTFYPYGLPIEPLSSYAAIKTANKELYQSKLLDEEMGSNYYYFDARYFDPQTGRFIGMDPKMQMASGYQGMGGNPAMYVDPDGNWLGIDDAIVSAVGFAYGYVSSGIKSGNWGWQSVGNGLASASMFELGYLTGGGGLAAGGSMSAAGSYLGSSAVNMAIGQVVPSANINLGGLNLSISPAFSTSGLGVNIGAGYSLGPLNVGFSYGFGYNTGTSDLSGGFKSASKGFYNSSGASLGANISSTYYGFTGGYTSLGGKAGQGIGYRAGQIGDFGVRVDEDLWGDGGDRNRTGGGTATYRMNNDVTVGIGLGMITGKANKDEYLKDNNPHRTYNYAYETPGAYRGGAAYGGIIYRGYASFIGINKENILHFVQNKIHDRTGTYYFQNLHLKSQPWSYFGNYSTNSLIY